MTHHPSLRPPPPPPPSELPLATEEDPSYPGRDNSTEAVEMESHTLIPCLDLPPPPPTGPPPHEAAPVGEPEPSTAENSSLSSSEENLIPPISAIRERASQAPNDHVWSYQPAGPCQLRFKPREKPWTLEQRHRYYPFAEVGDRWGKKVPLSCDC